MEKKAQHLFFGVMKKGDETLLFGCDPHDHASRSVSIFRSSDGVSFSSLEEEMVFTRFFGGLRRKSEVLEPFRISAVSSDEDRYLLLFRRRKNDKESSFFSAISRNGVQWNHVTEAQHIHGYGAAAPIGSREQPLYALFFGSGTVRCATSSDLKNWSVKRTTLLRPRTGFFDEKSLSVVSVIGAGNGILVFYSSQNAEGRVTIGSALVSTDNLSKVLWRTEEALWSAPEDWDERDVSVVGAVCERNRILFYWQVDGKLLIEEIAQFWKVSHGESVSIVSEGAKLEKYQRNPILCANRAHDWESGEVFNPAAFLSDDGMVHILYRATGGNGLSSIGYASSRDGLSIDERLEYPVYASSATLDDVRVTAFREQCSTPYSSGSGWGGSEDPKVTRIGDMLYMTYTAFDGYNFPRVALTKISLDDFLSRKWNWSRPVMISPPGEIHKNWTIFPEKIGGKFAVLHSISPEVRIDYFDSLDFDGETFIASERVMKPLPGRWELFVRGVGPSPMKTHKGWLVLYHATTRDCGYKLGAMLLDLQNPSRVIARSTTPILEPALWYENEGSKPGVVYSCGAVVKDNKLFVYYGGADTVTCVATVPISRLLSSLLAGEKVAPTRYVRLRDK